MQSCSHCILQVHKPFKEQQDTTNIFQRSIYKVLQGVFHYQKHLVKKVSVMLIPWVLFLFQTLVSCNGKKPTDLHVLSKLAFTTIAPLVGGRKKPSKNPNSLSYMSNTDLRSSRELTSCSMDAEQGHYYIMSISSSEILTPTVQVPIPYLNYTLHLCILHLLTILWPFHRKQKCALLSRLMSHNLWKVRFSLLLDIKW